MLAPTNYCMIEFEIQLLIGCVAVAEARGSMYDSKGKHGGDLLPMLLRPGPEGGRQN